MATNNARDILESYYSIFVLAALLILISITNLFNFLLFHTITEIFSIVIAVGIFIIGWHTRKFTESVFFVRYGIASLFIASIDLIHTLSYEGMGIFLGYDSNLPTQLWILARYIQAGSFIIALSPFIFKKTPYYLFIFYSIITIIFLFMIFHGIFPDCYISGLGLTPFKIVNEYIIIFILLLAIFLLYNQKETFSFDIFVLIGLSLITTVISELAFTLYISVYGLSNIIGHIFKILAFFFIYMGVIQIGLKDPIRVLFKQLKKREESLNQAYKRTNFYKNLFAHDVNNIFQNILSTLELYDIEKKDIQKYHYMIKNQIIRGEKLVKNVIKLTELDDYEEKLKSVNLKKKLSQSLSYLKESYPNKNIEIAREIPKEPIKIQANELINDIFENILINAVKYTQNDPIKIQIRISKIKKNGNYYVKLEFIDNGIGIPPSQREKIFESDLEKTSKTKGMGLGLSLVKKVIELYNGDIWIESRIKGEYDKGTNFVLLIPLAEKFKQHKN